MSFLIMHHYLIEPKPSLVARAEAVLGFEFAQVFLKPIVVAKLHQPTTDQKLEQANIRVLKQGFLARTFFDWAWDSPSQFAELLGDAKLETALFDQWWICREIEAIPFEDWQPYIQKAKHL